MTEDQLNTLLFTVSESAFTGHGWVLLRGVTYRLDRTEIRYRYDLISGNQEAPVLRSASIDEIRAYFDGEEL